MNMYNIFQTMNVKNVWW